MRIDVLFGAPLASSEVAGRMVVVIDVLRASTSIATALANGARAVIPLESSEEVVNRAKALERADVRLAGERKMLPMPGFDLGNSPREFTREIVEGKTILMTTTNGTAAITNTQGARDVVIGSYINYSAALAMMRAALRKGTDLAIVCAGRDRQFALEDAGCAGRFVTNLSKQRLSGEVSKRQSGEVSKRLSGDVTKRSSGIVMNDAAQACALIDRTYGDGILELFEASEHGRALRDAGFGDDLAACAAIDSYDVVPVYQDRQITKLGPRRER